MSPTAQLEAATARLRSVDLARRMGKVTRVLGLAAEVSGLEASVGDVCVIDATKPVTAEVVGLREGRLVLMPLGDVAGIRPGSTVRTTGRPQTAAVGEALLGRVVDGFGRPLDGGGAIATTTQRAIHRLPPPVMERRRIAEPLETGLRVLDGLLPIGRGQRAGIFAGSGVGKSMLLGSLASHAAAAVNVVALIGERGREVREFIERDLGAEGLARSVVVVATSNEPALLRRQAAFTATTIAEHFRDEGKAVLFMMDSLTRFAMAQREIGLAVGEPPATRGYPPSVFALLPRLLERAGTTAHDGSITALYTVLVEGDDMNDPIGDTARAILDGHIVLSRDLATANHFPAVDVLASVSRLADTLATPEQATAAAAVRDCLAAYHDARDLITIGAYATGSDPRIDRAVATRAAITAFLRQPPHQPTARAETFRRLRALVPEGRA